MLDDPQYEHYISAPFRGLWLVEEPMAARTSKNKKKAGGAARSSKTATKARKSKSASKSSRRTKPAAAKPVTKKAATKRAAASSKKAPKRAAAAPAKKTAKATTTTKTTKVKKKISPAKARAAARRMAEPFRKLLVKRHRELMRSYQTTKGDTRASTADGTEDYIDYAVSSYTREFSLSLTEMERHQLQMVEEALKRIERGEFGRCMQCGQEIPPKRLEVEPWARHCIRCQELEERGLLEERIFGDGTDSADDAAGAPEADTAGGSARASRAARAEMDDEEEELEEESLSV